LNPAKILKFAAALGALAAAGVVVVVAAALAVYALARTWLPPAACAAIVAAVFALIVAAVAWSAARKAAPKRKAGPEASPIDQLMGLIRDKPLIALGAVAAAGFMLVRNPALATAIVTAFMAGEQAKPGR
jgi:hypothetical protein